MVICPDCGELSIPVACEVCGRELRDEAPVMRFEEAWRFDDSEPEPLGEGTFATVRVCRRLDDNTRWAVKVVDLEKASSKPEIQAKTRASFLREARALSRFDHPNLVRVHGFGVIDSRRLFMVMDLLPRSCTLHEALQNAWRRGRGPSLGTVVRMGMEIGSALGYVHGRGVVHRDLKPGNIGIDFHRRFRLLDFGLLKRVGHDDATAEAPSNSFERPGAELTVAGWGSFSYGAPEQFLRGEVGPWTDLFALGNVLYEMVAGHPPVKNRTLSETLVAFEEPAPPLPVDPRRPEAFDEVVAWLLARDPAERPQSVAPVLERLTKVWQAVARDRRARAKDTLLMAPVVSPVPQVKVVRRSQPEATATVGAEQLELLLQQTRGIGHVESPEPTAVSAPPSEMEPTVFASQPTPEASPETPRPGSRTIHVDPALDVELTPLVPVPPAPREDSPGWLRRAWRWVVNVWAAPADDPGPHGDSSRTSESA